MGENPFALADGMSHLNAEFSSAYAEFFKRAVLKSVFSFALFLFSAIMAPTERFFRILSMLKGYPDLVCETKLRISEFTFAIQNAKYLPVHNRFILSILE